MNRQGGRENAGFAAVPPAHPSPSGCVCVKPQGARQLISEHADLGRERDLSLDGGEPKTAEPTLSPKLLDGYAYSHQIRGVSWLESWNPLTWG
jgi:hypothetical protein